MRRHEALRTVFADGPQGPRQIVQPSAPVELPVADLSGLPDDRRLPEARRLAADVAFAPFDLTRGPLLRSALLSLAGNDHVMAYAAHRLVADIWSLQMLGHEVRTGYLARSRGRLPTLPELPIQFRDYAAWQQSALRDAALQERLAWWQDRLAGAPARPIAIFLKTQKA